MERAAKLARGAHRLLDLALGVVLGLVFLFGAYALLDTWRIYREAGVDEALLQYKPAAAHKADGAGFAGLQAVNPEVCAWLTVDGTHIDYPLLHTSDNTKYVNTDVYGEFSLSGSLFVDYRNAADFTDRYTLVYGHHMDAATMFGELAYFLQPDYFDAHSTGTLYLPDGACAIELFACVQTDAFDPQIFYPPARTEEETDALLAHIRENAVQYRDIGVTGRDRLIGLSTCSDAATDARTVVFGRLVTVEPTEGDVTRS